MHRILGIKQGTDQVDVQQGLHQISSSSRSLLTCLLVTNWALLLVKGRNPPTVLESLELLLKTNWVVSAWRNSF